jgi:hypothetical protein
MWSFVDPFVVDFEKGLDVESDEREDFSAFFCHHEGLWNGDFGVMSCVLGMAVEADRADPQVRSPKVDA